METPGATSGPAAVTGTNAATTAVRWQVGQLLQATVLENTAGKIVLSIGNRQVSSETSLPLEKGQQLTVQIRSLGDIPVLRITSGLVTPPLVQAIRSLIPQQNSMAPLLASLAQLAQTAHPPVPPLIRELTRAMVRNLPDSTALTRPDTLRTAIERSGLFLERNLAQQLVAGAVKTANSAPVAAIEKDFKGSLLQLIERLQNWPGSAPLPRPPGAANPALPPPPTTGQTSTAPGAIPAPLREPPPTTPVAGTRNGAGSTNPLPGSGAANAPQATSTLSANQLHRAIQAGMQTPLAGVRALPVSTPVTLTTLTSPIGTRPGAVSSPLPGTVPPPFPGSAPAPQAAAQATLDLLNRIGTLRTDLLRQTEAALARLQLHQLASQPRDAERGWLEWLFELPVRRGDDIDLWSMRFTREQSQRNAQKHKAQHQWSVQLAFDLPGLGPVQAQVTLHGERVSTRFWAGKKTALPLFRENLQTLQTLFSQAGLEVGKLDCVPGPMPSAGTAPSLIREKV